MKSPALAAITLDPTGGGVALVSRLLWQSLRARWASRTRLVTMFDGNTHPATFVEKCRFGTAMFSAQTLHRHDFILFAHVGLARVQNGIPDALRRPYAVFLHGIEAWNALTPPEEMALRRATLLIANSHYTARRIADSHPWLGPIEVCPLALPAGMNGRAGRARTWSPRMLMVGRMAAAERYKGHDLVLNTWPAVVQAVPAARLVIAGTGDDLERLKGVAARTGIASSVDFTGFVTDSELQALYEHASVFVLPSRGEGFGLVYLEAMAHGIPCIGSTADAATEVIVDGETGRLVNPDVPGELATAMVHLLSDERLRIRMGESGASRARDLFSYERFDARVNALLDSVATRTS